jgi:AAA family ATP:ADP antiporter
MPMTPDRRPSASDRFLSVFAEVRAGESGTALLLALNVFLILMAYYVLRVVREPLILAGGGAELKSYSAAGQAVLLLALVPVYSRLAQRLPRRQLINAVTVFFVGCLAVFYVVARLEVPYLGVAFYLWVGIFNLVVVAQFWSFANDVYTTGEGKRLFPMVGVGASAGAVCGSWVAGQLIGWVGLYALLPIAAAILMAAAGITGIVDVRERRRTEAQASDVLSSGTLPAATSQYRIESGEFKVVTRKHLEESGTFRVLSPGEKPPEPERPAATGGGFALVFRSRYLLTIGLLVLVLNWVNTTGEYILGQRIAEAAASAARESGISEREFIGAFYARFLSGAALTGLLIQFFLVSRIVKLFGIGRSLLVLPGIACAGYALIAFAPALAALRWVKTAENATDYSLQKTVGNALFLPTTREEKYQAKQAIDGFFWRAGDVLSAVVVYLGTHWLSFGPSQFAIVNLGLTLLWAGLAVTVGRRYGRLAAVTAA